MATKVDLPSLIKNARKLRGLTQAKFGAQFGRGQSLVSKYEKGLVEPPGEIIMHCMTITRGEDAMSPQDVARLIEQRLGAPEFAKLRSAIGTLIQSVPTPTPLKRTKK
jgi:transcriptional regulator with XRE-family HTH domain